MTPPPPPPPAPPAAPIRVLLSVESSSILDDAGQWFCLQAYKSAMPEHRGRFVLLAVPVLKQVADDCARVVKGTHRATKIRTPKANNP